MVRKYSLYRIAHWLRTNREQLSKASLDEVKNRMIREGLGLTTATRPPDREGGGNDQ